MTSHLSSFHTSTPKDSGAIPKVMSQDVSSNYFDFLDDSFDDDFVPFDRDQDLSSVSRESIKREFEELTARFNRCKQELDRTSGSNVRVQAAENKQDRRVTFDLPVHSASSLDTISRKVQFEKDALIKRIQELEKSERDLSTQLENSLHFATPLTNRSTSVPETPDAHRATPTQATPHASRVTSIPETPQFNQTTSTQSMPQTDRSTPRRHTSRSDRFTPVD